MIQVIEMTYEEKIQMYMKLSKKELVKMLIESNRCLDALTVDPSWRALPPTSKPWVIDETNVDVDVFFH